MWTCPECGSANRPSDMFNMVYDHWRRSGIWCGVQIGIGVVLPVASVVLRFSGILPVSNTVTYIWTAWPVVCGVFGATLSVFVFGRYRRWFTRTLAAICSLILSILVLTPFMLVLGFFSGMYIVSPL